MPQDLHITPGGWASEPVHWGFQNNPPSDDIGFDDPPDDNHQAQAEAPDFPDWWLD